MIGTTGATMLFIINIVFAGVLGIGAGGLACLVLRQPWGVREALLDAILAAGVALIAAYVLAAMEASRGVWGSLVGLVLAIAAASVVARHLIRLALRFAR
jgi:hypothetical protein